MPAPSSIHKQFSDALNDAFDRAELERIVDFDLGVRYENVVRQGGTFSNECDDIIRWADKHDRLDELRLAAYAANPDNQTLLRFVQQVDVGFIEAHVQAARLTKGQSESEAAPSIAALPPATGLQASVVAASLGEQTISLDLAIKRQLEARRRICVIEVPGQSIGTGFLIGPRLVLTNRHVLDAALRLNPAEIRAVFDYSGDQNYQSLPRKKFLLNAPVVMDEVNGLDYAVLPLESDVEADRGFFTACLQPLGDKSSVTIMGHPAQGTTALGLQYSWGMIRDINDQAKRIAYTAQTGPGSSGSPIFNANFELVGLHHHGQAGVNNHGIPIEAIFESLKLKGLGTSSKQPPGVPFNSTHKSLEASPTLPPRHEGFIDNQSGNGPLEKTSGRVLFGLHGIRTHANWNRALYEVATKDNWQVRTDRWNFGYFSIVQFLMPWARSAKVMWFREAYRQEIDDKKVHLNDGQHPSVVAHSFGSYILGYALLKYDWLRFDKVVLCGSILPVDFPWDKLIERGQVQAVRNEIGVEDVWSRLVQWFVAGTGPSGQAGFRCQHERLEQESFEYTHSEYFDKGHMEAKWLPFINHDVSQIPAAGTPVKRPKASRPWATYAVQAIFLLAISFQVLKVKGLIGGDSAPGNDTQHVSAPKIVSPPENHSEGSELFSEDKSHNPGSGDGTADEVSFLIAADTSTGGPLQAAHNITLMQAVASLAKQPKVQILKGTNCNDATFTSALSVLAARASEAKANNRNMKVIIHLSCQGSDTSLMVSSAQRQIVRDRSEYEALARQIRQEGATGVLFLCDSCATKSSMEEWTQPMFPSLNGGNAIPVGAGDAVLRNGAGMTYVNYFTGFVVINGCTPPPAGPRQSGEVCIYTSDRGGVFTNGIYNTLTSVNFTTSHNGFVSSVAQNMDNLFDHFSTNGGVAIDGRTYTRQKPFFRVLEP